ncbi:unnamed protein product [Trifolium pratense]|uniref:Uncharacterized protein n=1 Tax=Trifolium pratense TaxID=57577 RepID=A0ACB0ISS8_TRIPR|nr:unnamed protein product [Trifolium pratense]
MASSLLKLPYLRQLKLPFNQLSGLLGGFDSACSPVLEMLDLSNNNLQECIPTSVFNLTTLRVIQLSSNKFTGTIKLDIIRKLSNLTILDLSKNNLSVDENFRVDHDLSPFPEIRSVMLSSCKLRSVRQMLLHPRNPCEALCMKLLLNVDDTEPSRTIVDAQNRVVVRENGPTFLVFDDLKIVPSSVITSLCLLKEFGYSDLSQLEEITHNIGKQEILNILKYSFTSHEPLTNAILRSCSRNKYNPPNQSSSAVRVRPCTSDSNKTDIKVVQSKSQKTIIFAEADGEFVNFIFSFLTMPLGSIVKVLVANSFVGCVGNLYKSVENLVPTSVLLNPGIAPHFGCPNQPLNIPAIQPQLTTYYYGTGLPSTCGTRVKEGVVGFVKKAALYGVGDDLTVKPLSANSCLSYFKESSIPFDDLEVKVISIGEVEALSLLRASLTSKFTLTIGLGDLLNVPEHESTLTSTN